MKTLIVKLKDENGELVEMYEGSHYWYASAEYKKAVRNPIDSYHANVHHWGEEERRFATEKAAQKFLDAEAVVGLSVYQVMPVLIKALKEDPDYYYSWQANIAMAFQDEYQRHAVNPKPIHEISNNAAKHFLNLLIR